MNTAQETKTSQVSPISELLNRQSSPVTTAITEEQVRAWITETSKELGSHMLSAGTLGDGTYHLTVYDGNYEYHHCDTLAEAREWLATRTPDVIKRKQLEEARRKVAELESELATA